MYLFTSVLAMTCVFGTHLELRVAGGFGSHPPRCLQKTEVTCWGQAEGEERDRCRLRRGWAPVSVSAY